jgi:hypothetical protein
MEIDKHGTLYLGDLEHSSIVRISPDLKTRTTLVSDGRLVWPDSYAISPTATCTSARRISTRLRRKTVVWTSGSSPTACFA